MFNFARSMFDTSRGRRGAKKGRAKPVGSQVECLEPRCMLSLAPAFATEVPQIPVPVLSLSEVVNMADSPMRDPSMGGSSPGRTPQGVTPLRPAPALDESYENMPDDDDGTYINLHNVPATPGEVLSSQAADKDTRDVLALLAALKFVPNDANSPATATPGMESPRDPGRRLHSLADETPLLSPTVRLEQSPAVGAASSGPTQKDLSDGGMIALVRRPLTEEAPARVPQARLEALLQVPVQMDSVYGKFQAFEVSTTEDVSASTAPPAAREGDNAPQKALLEGDPQASLESAPDTTVQLAADAMDRPLQDATMPPLWSITGDEDTAPHLDFAAVLFVAAAYSARRAAANRVDDHTSKPVPSMRLHC